MKKSVMDYIKLNKNIMDNEVLKDVVSTVEEQTKKGLEKYGKTVDPNSLETIEWLKHFREEMIDGAVYATCVIKKLEELQNESK